ncbi:adenylate kinase family protein [Anaplasma bovis]|uniref:adenylate kinase family protein n=1 Tax=Anaplasma bovis TaxID=186733 RepID=UPI002FEE7E06
MEKSKVGLLIFGAPGSGKGTQTRLLAEHLKGITAICVGDLLREEVRASTEIGAEIARVMESGALVSDVLVCEMVLRKLRYMGEGGFLLDGFPRNMLQAEFLEIALRLLDCKVNLVIKLEVDPVSIIKRLEGRLVCNQCGSISNIGFQEDSCSKCGSSDYTRRRDDESYVVERRILEYERVVRELEGYYGDKVVKINGNKPVDEVFADIRGKVVGINN